MTTSGLSDLEVIEAMLSRAGIKYSKDAVTTGHQEPVGVTSVTTDPYAPNALGYGGFYADLRFDADGALVAAGAWE